MFDINTTETLGPHLGKILSNEQLNGIIEVISSRK
jgi:hypothetical protein